jgi:hypothetical protein
MTWQLSKERVVILLIFLGVAGVGHASPFVHPGGLHTLADLDRMKTNVLAGNHPWIDDWNRLLTDPEAQSNWKPAPKPNMGTSRQRADKDAHAAYLNTLRWYISGDTNYAECAVKICNAWSRTVNQVPSGTDIPGLSGIPVFDFALAGELLRIYPGWRREDFEAYTNMMVRYYYPVCHEFLADHDGRCISYFWANWDACNLGALVAMGVLCDNTNIFDEGVEYFKNGPGNGSISNAVPYLYSTYLGQWQESGRDQEHAQLGVGLLGAACQVAWNQGVDLFGYANNRLLAGAEYVAKCNLSYPPSTIPYTLYDNCANARQFYLSASQLGRIDDRPVWELIYNHYAVLRGLPAPYSKAMAQLVRPEGGGGDHFGYGTLTFTLNADASSYPPNPIPPAPTGLKADAGVSRVFLNWEKDANDTAQGYVIRRSGNAHGPFVTIAVKNNDTVTHYMDTSVSDGNTYYYVVAAANQSGTSGYSEPVWSQPAAAGLLPSGWLDTTIGTVGAAGTAQYSEAGGNTFIVNGAGGNISEESDALNFTHRAAAGDFIFTARLLSAEWSSRDNVGLIVRESLAPRSKALSLVLGGVGNRECRFGTRVGEGASTTWQFGDDYTVVPVWFRIQRSGNVFSGYQSADGTNWFKAGSSSVVMPNQCQIGLAAVGQRQNRFDTCTFDHVTIQQASQ